MFDGVVDDIEDKIYQREDIVHDPRDPADIEAEDLAVV